MNKRLKLKDNKLVLKGKIIKDTIYFCLATLSGKRTHR